MAERKKKAKKEHRIDLTISYDFIKSMVQQVYDYPQQIYIGPNNKGKSFAVDVSSRVDRIILENALIVTDDLKNVYIPRRHEVVPWVNAVNKSNLSTDEIIKDWKKVSVLRDGRQLEGNYEIEGVVYNYRALEPFTNKLYLFAESAKFRFDSENYAKHVVKYGNSRVNVVKDKDGTLSLENVVITVNDVGVRNIHHKLLGNAIGELSISFYGQILAKSRNR